MKIAALIYLAGDDSAQRLVMAWPLLQPAERGRPLTERTLRTWAHLASVSELAAEQLGPPLVLHDIVLADGSIDPLAEDYIAQRFAKANGNPGQQPAAPDATSP